MSSQVANHDSTESTPNGVVAWLMEGDPIIRWQTIRDLGDEPPDTWEAERRSMLQTAPP